VLDRFDELTDWLSTELGPAGVDPSGTPQEAEYEWAAQPPSQ
jgi:hypothetical protein